MAIVQIKCPETGKSVDVETQQPGWGHKAHGFSKPIPCPHCGMEHAWTSHDRALAVEALEACPEASRVLVYGEHGSRSATALP